MGRCCKGPVWQRAYLSSSPLVSIGLLSFATPLIQQQQQQKLDFQNYLSVLYFLEVCYINSANGKHIFGALGPLTMRLDFPYLISTNKEA